MNAKEIARSLSEHAEMVARHLYPQGKRMGREYLVGSVSGEQGESLRICVAGGKAGVWADFASDKRGDLLDLWMEARGGIGLVEAMGEAATFLGVEDKRPSFYGQTARAWKKPVIPKCTTVKQGKVCDYLTVDRKLTVETIRKFKVADGGESIVFPFIRDGETVMVKRLMLERVNGKKDIRPTSDGQEPILFGWQAIDPKSRKVIICEGEIDAMSLYQMGHDALSIPFGAGGGQTWIENEYDRVARFDEVYVCMDQDAAGEKAAAEIVERLGRHRCKILKLGKYNDANEALQNGYDIFNLQADLNNAKACDPEELRQLSDFHDEIMEEFYPADDRKKGAKLPWRKTHDRIRFRAGDISVWAGVNSHGKSVMLSHLVVDLVAQGYRVCIASMEMPAKDQGHKMYRQIGGNDKPTHGYANKIRQFIQDGVWIFNAYGTAKADRIIQVFEYAYFRYDVKHFVVDSLAKCGFAEDDYNNQKAFIDRLMEFGKQHGVHVHVVIHIRKLEDEAKIPGKFDVKGTGGLTDMVDNVLIIWRNKKKEKIFQLGDESDMAAVAAQPDAYLSIVKQRKTGDEPTFSLWFHPASCQFLESAGTEIVRYIREQEDMADV